MREKLLDYLVGGLDSQECEQVRKALEENPLLEQELNHLVTLGILILILVVLM